MVRFAYLATTIWITVAVEMFAVDLPKITDNGGIYYYLYTSLFVLLFYG